MSDQEGVFRFELNESLYFESGQEVAEIIGVSLDPEISIQAFHEYVSIRGVIELSGDYHKVRLSNTLDEAPFELNDFHGKHFIEQVIDKTDSLAAFTHRFPVEISVPSYRVNDLEEVTVQVASFDYEIPNHHQMKLMAVIEIEGINEEIPPVNEAQPFIPQAVEDEVEQVNDMEDATPSMETEEDNEMNVEPDKEEMAGETPITEEEPVLEPEPEPEPEPVLQQEPEEQEQEKKEPKKTKKSQPLSDFFKKSEQKNMDVSEMSDELSEEKNVKTSETEDTEETEEIIKTNETGRESEHSNTPINSLSEMFEHDKEDKYAKMRLCIVQDSDTIEIIAERYETTTNQLISKNRLNDESITEGQLLYIPEKVSK